MSGAGSMSSNKMGLINGICGILCDTGFIDWLGHGRCWGGGSMQCASWFEVVTHTRGTPSINGNHMGFG